MFYFNFFYLLLFFNFYPDTVKLDYVYDDFIFENPLYKNSLQVISENRILKENDDFYFDGKKISFSKPFKDVKIIFLKVDDSLKIENYRYRSENVIEEIAKKDEEKENNIYIAGVKGISLLNQNNSLDIDQVTEFSINGNIDSFWSVEGYINDNSSTKDLGLNIPVYQIENFRISLKNINGTQFFLGNSTMKNSWSKFLNFNKEIFGLGFLSNFKRYPIYFNYSTDKGNFRTTSFYCMDGILGPYRIVDEKNLFDYTITPGSERVYLNGELLQNGEDKDYTIDYYTGEITFTNKQIVDQNSYVYIEFQQLNITSLNSGYNISFGDEGNDLRVLYSNQGNQIFDQKLKDELSLYPSDSSYILLKGYQFVGSGNGDYSFIDSIFNFVGKGNGDYIVEFYYVGYGNGDYIYSPVNFSYIYVGKNNGNYSPYRRVELPFFYHLFDISYSKDFKIGKYDFEILTGLYKNNRYNLQSEFLKDFSYLLFYESKKISYGKFSSSFSFKFKENDTIFKTKWNKKNDYGYIRSDTTFKTPFREISFSLQPSFEKILKSNLTFSKLDSFNVINTNFNSDTIFDYNLDFKTNYFLLKDSFFYRNENITLTRYFKLTNISIFIENEKKIFSTLKRGIRSFTSNRDFLLEYRNEETFNDTFKAKNIDVFKFEINRFKDENFSGLIMAEYKIFDENNSKKNILALNMIYKNNKKNFYEYVLNTYITSLSIYDLVETYVYVGKGKGEYIYDPQTNTYIYDRIYGEYILIKENKMSNEPFSKRNLNTTFRFYPFETFLTFDYSDLSKNILETKQSYLNQSNLKFNLLSNKILNKRLTPFFNINYERTFYKNISYLKNSALDIGLKNTKDLNYSVFYRREDETRDENSGRYDISSNSFVFEFNLTGLKEDYNFSILYGYFYGYYDYTTLGFSRLDGNKAEFSSDIERKIFPNFSFNIIPKVSYTLYKNGDDMPLNINYKYPKGTYFENTLSLLYTTSFINIKISHIMDYSVRNSLRQRIFFSLFTYF
uniref:Uncharacterized protein n=1 Tax=candidate division WOR-3 bacterium TaxID=2052148 RepID=A0A7C3J5J9_UNCW3